jgi:hypothetical protein
VVPLLVVEESSVAAAMKATWRALTIDWYTCNTQIIRVLTAYYLSDNTPAYYLSDNTPAYYLTDNISFWEVICSCLLELVGVDRV